MLFSTPFIRTVQTLLAASALALTACAGGGTPEPEGGEPEASEPEVSEPETSEPDVGDDFEPALLEEFRAVIPSAEVLESPAPQATVNAQIGNPATYPALAAPQIIAVNQTVRGLVDTLGAITDLPPTLYNSEEREFLWGPFDNDDSPIEGDKVLVYIKDAPDGADFDYHYAFIRTMGNDVADWTAVIWGGANPDADDPDHYGNGVVLYDFEANADFATTHNADVTRDMLHQGRFAIAYMRGPGDGNEPHDVTAVVSTFRNFAGPGDEPIDFEQLYGNVHNLENDDRVEFVDIQTEADVHEGEEGNEANEDISLRLAFYNRGIGRAEAIVTGGDLVSDTGESEASAVECWDDVLARSYFTFDVSGEAAGGEDSVNILTEGTSDMCGHFESTLDELGIPGMADLDQGLLDGLSEVAENGIGD